MAARARYAHERGIEIIGDVPIFVGHDSADVWATASCFTWTPAGRPTVVAGVPPDYFSATGQLWGNPLYRWDVMQADGYAWWVDAPARTRCGRWICVRMDHFRGFRGLLGGAGWRGARPCTAAGCWGRARACSRRCRRALGALPIIAEDLGVITP